MGLITFTNGSMLDHIAWAVPDVVTGCRELADLTDVEPFLSPEPEPGQWYWSGGLPLGNGQLLEIIGPAPAFQGFHPLRAMMAGLATPRLLFWYVGTDDIDAFVAHAAGVGVVSTPIEANEHAPESGLSSYRRAILLGPSGGFDPVMPSVIQWTRRRPEFDASGASEVMLDVFELEHPAAAAMQSLFDKLGIDQHVSPGAEPVLRLKLNTLNGPVTLDGRGNPAEPPPA